MAMTPLSLSGLRQSTIARDIVAGAFLMVGSATAFRSQTPTPPYNYGASWRSQTVAARIMFLHGVIAGVESVAVLGSDLRLSNRTPLGLATLVALAPSLRTLSAAQRESVSVTILRTADKAGWEPFSAETVASVMTQFYADRADDYISWGEVLGLALMKLRGEDPARIQEMEGIARRVAATDTTTRPR